MVKPYDTRLIAVVAQDHFEVDSFRFCKLVPLVYADGDKPQQSDFPNDGEIWWMLTAQSAHLANPGRLVACNVEDAPQYDEHDPAKSRYQVQRDSARDLNPNDDGLEILTVPSNALDNVQDLVSSGYRMGCNHHPPPKVLIRWRGDVYGPFETMIKSDDPNLHISVSFAPADVSKMTVYKISSGVLEERAATALNNITTSISPTQQRRSESSIQQPVHHEFLLAPGFDRVLATNPPKLVLEPIDRKLVRFAKKCLTRKKRQQLRALLEELQITGEDTEDAEELATAIKHVHSVSEEQDSALDAVSKALLESGVLGEERLNRAEEEYAASYVQERTAELQAEIEQNVSINRQELREVEDQLKGMRARLAKQESEGREHLKAQLDAERKKDKSEIEAEWSKLKRDKQEFQRQENLLKQNLEKVIQEYRDEGDEVVNRFLAIAPLLRRTALDAPSVSDGVPEPQKIEPAPILPVPSYITTETSNDGETLAEDEFFDRFRRVVENNGFAYRRLDLQRFHMSVKCGDLTILGGPSGTGKSSLPTLYANALLGDDGNVSRNGCLMINVNPSWIDVRDLLGHLNTLDRRYYPAESGLFQHLIYAQEEYATNDDNTGLYLTCLDEMNLSQVEHYFSDFMTVLERTAADRAIQCFTSESIDEHCVFRDWGRITLVPSLRFVGTVNFDETTRLLSDRLLDRVNLIRLESGSLPSSSGVETNVPNGAEGRMVSLADFKSWLRDGALSSDLGSLLDSLRPSLSTLGFPLSPRSYRAICRYVSSASNIMVPAIAFDTQIAQRIVPKLRNLMAPSQFDALDNLIKVLEGSSVGTFDESLQLLTELRESRQSGMWDLEE